MTGLLWAALGIISGLGMTAIGDMVSEEVRDRLDHLPHAVLRLAARRLDPALRTPLYDEIWLPDLAYHLKGAEARPVTRLYHGICFAVGMLASAHRSSRNLSRARPQGNVQPTPDVNDGVTAAIDAVKAMASPYQLVTHDFLEAAISGNRLLVTGDVDIASLRSFRAALRVLDAVPANTLILDITGLSFMDAGGIGAVGQFAAALTPPRRLEVQCGGHVNRVMNTCLGGLAISQLSINNC